MAISSTNPQYALRSPDWIAARDAFAGERQVKSKRTEYLSPTSGMIDDGMSSPNQDGWKAFDAYLARARFPDAVKEAIEAMVGILWTKPPKIEVPEALSYLLERATSKNESLEMALRRINTQQLITGRVGVLLDVIDEGPRAGELYLSLYDAETGINWDSGRRDGVEVQNLNLVILNESGFEREEDFTWVEHRKYRVLQLVLDPNKVAASGEGVQEIPQGLGVCVVGVFRDTDYTPDGMKEISVSGNTFDEIPFVFINAADIVPDTDDPPLQGLIRLCYAWYRLSADYYQALFLQGQDTLVIVNGDPAQKVRVGADQAIHVATGGDAKYVGVGAAGLPELRAAMEADERRADKKSGQLVESTSRVQESGEALKVRVAARTTTLRQVAMAGAAGLAELLKMAARVVGADPEAVVVEPALDFIPESIAGADIAQLVTAKIQGGPFAWETLHDFFRERGFTKLTFEEELDRVRGENQAGIADLLRESAATQPAPTVGPDGKPIDQSQPPEDPNQEPDAPPKEQPADAA